MNVFITGCARTGTSLLTLLMVGFDALTVHAETEINPVRFNSSGHGREVIKFPQDNKMADADFGIPDQEEDPQVCYLSYYLPTWQVIICLRDTRDVLVSNHAAFTQKYFGSPERCKGALERDVAAMYHPHVLLVRYEELVTFPERVLARIGVFLEEEYDYTYLERFYKNLNPDTMMARALNGARPVDAASVGAWRRPQHCQRLTEIAPYYNEHIAPLMRRLGYVDCEI